MMLTTHAAKIKRVKGIVGFVRSIPMYLRVVVLYINNYDIDLHPNSLYYSDAVFALI